MFNRKIIPSRFKLAKTFALITLFLSLIVRIILYSLSLNTITPSLFNFISILSIGFFFDIGVISYALSPYVIYLLVIPSKYHGSKLDKILTKLIYGILLFIFIFSFLGEIPFWQEYHRRYNFIAVDYLLYTYEVVQNIHESYPLPLLIGCILGILFLGIKYTVKTNAYKLTFNSKNSLAQKLPIAFFIFSIFLLFHFYIKNTDAEFFQNINVNEIAKSGLYSFFAAYKSNELNYHDFYKTISKKKADSILRNKYDTKQSVLINTHGIKRKIKNKGVEKKPNIIFIGLESLNARFMTAFGNNQNWTPTLDSLAKKSIFFSNLYATGTRTIRGIEAISLSIPPTPGRSIVKRSNNENLSTIGHIFRQKGYSRTFLYGGDSHFDNMCHYFSHNGFDIVDRKKAHRINELLPTKRLHISDNETTFENAWAVCDQDLLKKSLKIIDQQHQSKKPFFNFIMTSSNHKPYTYPKNVIEYPPGKDIIGSIKYLDKSLNEFFNIAKNKPWFKNTVFVIMSDHCAFSAGRTEINIENHHIPALIYNIKDIENQQINKLCSQIDIFPTLFGFLNWDYTSNLFGKDIRLMKTNDERALIGNHRKIGLLKPQELLLLETSKKYSNYYWDKKNNKLNIKETNFDLLNETITYYQSAFYMFKNNDLKIN